VRASLGDAQGSLDDAVKIIFESDPRVRSVGIGRHEDSYGFYVIRNAAQIVALSARVQPPDSFRGISVSYHDRQSDIYSHLRLPFNGPGSPGVSSLVPEQQKHNPLSCGLQIENYDDDLSTGTIAAGHIIVGTLGCFVALADGSVALLSNNHVVAGENRGTKASDRIMQPGAGTFSAAGQAATLTDFVVLRPSPPGASPAAGTAILNDIDAGVATVKSGGNFKQSYLALRPVPAPSGKASASVGDKVFKVGRTTALTHGEITAFGVVVGPVGYSAQLGQCWFRRSITIEGVDGTMFSDHGDSGSVVVKEKTGEVVGLLYAGNGVDTWACSIDDVLASLNCTIA